jgi:hypothetical protein
VDMMSVLPEAAGIWFLAVGKQSLNLILMSGHAGICRKIGLFAALCG